MAFPSSTATRPSVPPEILVILWVALDFLLRASRPTIAKPSEILCWLIVASYEQVARLCQTVVIPNEMEDNCPRQILASVDVNFKLQACFYLMQRLRSQGVCKESRNTDHAPIGEKCGRPANRLQARQDGPVDSTMTSIEHGSRGSCHAGSLIMERQHGYTRTMHGVLRCRMAATVQR